MSRHELQGLQLEWHEDGARIDPAHGDGTHHDAVADERHTRPDGDRHDRLTTDRRRVALRAEMLVHHGHTVPNGTAGDALTGTDLSADGVGSDSLPGAYDVRAALAVERRDRDEIGREQVGAGSTTGETDRVGCHGRQSRGNCDHGFRALTYSPRG